MRWRPLNKPLGVSCVGEVERSLPSRDDVVSTAVMDVARSEQGDARVVVALVVPVEELGEEGPGFLEGAESGRHGGLVLEGLEDGFGVRVIVGDAGSAVARG